MDAPCYDSKLTSFYDFFIFSTLRWRLHQTLGSSFFFWYSHRSDVCIFRLRENFCNLISEIKSWWFKEFKKKYIKKVFKKNQSSLFLEFFYEWNEPHDLRNFVGFSLTLTSWWWKFALYRNKLKFTHRKCSAIIRKSKLMKLIPFSNLFNLVNQKEIKKIIKENFQSKAKD